MTKLARFQVTLLCMRAPPRSKDSKLIVSALHSFHFSQKALYANAPLYLHLS